MDFVNGPNVPTTIQSFISGDDLYTTTDEDPEFMYDTQAIHVNPCKYLVAYYIQPSCTFPPKNNFRCTQEIADSVNHNVYIK